MNNEIGAHIYVSAGSGGLTLHTAIFWVQIHIKGQNLKVKCLVKPH